MLKKILLILGAVLLGILLCFAAIKGYTVYQASQYDPVAIPFLQKVIPEISTWQEDTIRENMSPEALENTTPERFAAIVDRFARLGVLKSFSTPHFEEVSETRSGNAISGSGPATTIVTYVADAVYENGDATINFKLAVRDNGLEVEYFTIQSEVLTN